MLMGMMVIVQVLTGGEGGVNGLDCSGLGMSHTLAFWHAHTNVSERYIASIFTNTRDGGARNIATLLSTILHCIR
jgi:hypothetical protein